LTPNNVDIFSADTLELISGGRLSALGTAVPDMEISGTATPTLQGDTFSGGIANQPIRDVIQSRPVWLQLVFTLVGAGVTVILLATIFKQIRSRKK